MVDGGIVWLEIPVVHAVRVAVAALLHVTGYTRVAMRLADRLPESASTEPRGAQVSELLNDAPMLRKLWRKVRGVESRACDKWRWVCVCVGGRTLNTLTRVLHCC